MHRRFFPCKHGKDFFFRWCRKGMTTVHVFWVRNRMTSLVSCVGGFKGDPCSTESFETPTKHWSGPTTWMAQQLSVSWMNTKATLLRQDLLQGDGCFICFFFCRGLPFTSKGSSTSTGSLGWAGKGMKKEVLDDFEIFRDVELKKQHCMLGAHSRRLHLTHFNKISPSIPCLVGSKNLPFQPSKKDYKATDGPWFVCVADSEDLEGNSLRQTTRWGNEGVGHTVLACSISRRVRYRSLLWKRFSRVMHLGNIVFQWNSAARFRKIGSDIRSDLELHEWMHVSF